MKKILPHRIPIGILWRDPVETHKWDVLFYVWEAMRFDVDQYGAESVTLADYLKAHPERTDEARQMIRDAVSRGADPMR